MREIRASTVLWSTFTPSKKNMSHALRTVGQGSDLKAESMRGREREREGGRGKREGTCMN